MSNLMLLLLLANEDVKMRNVRYAGYLPALISSLLSFPLFPSICLPHPKHPSIHSSKHSIPFHPSRQTETALSSLNPPTQPHHSTNVSNLLSPSELYFLYQER